MQIKKRPIYPSHGLVGLERHFDCQTTFYTFGIIRNLHLKVNNKVFIEAEYLKAQIRGMTRLPYPLALYVLLFNHTGVHDRFGNFKYWIGFIQPY